MKVRGLRILTISRWLTVCLLLSACVFSCISQYSLSFVCFTDGSLSLSVPPDEDRVRNKQRKELHRRRGPLLGQCKKFPPVFLIFFCLKKWFVEDSMISIFKTRANYSLLHPLLGIVSHKRNIKLEQPLIGILIFRFVCCTNLGLTKRTCMKS